MYLIVYLAYYCISKQKSVSSTRQSSSGTPRAHPVIIIIIIIIVIIIVVVVIIISIIITLFYFGKIIQNKTYYKNQAQLQKAGQQKMIKTNLLSSYIYLEIQK